MNSNVKRFNTICADLWGHEWHPLAAKSLGVSRRTIVYWANGDHAPKDSDWSPIFSKLRKICEVNAAVFAARAKRLEGYAKAI